ncbi:AMP-binding enzyme, partial [Agrococcus terreus]
GPNVFDRYWRNPEKTREEKRDNGFFITGDQGFYDTEGYLHISGRSKDMIISGGYNVYPKEVEQLLDEHPLIAESAVIGVPDADLGEGVLAVVVARNGQAPDATELTGMLSDQLARYKQPRAYRVVEQLPRNVMGKVQKAQLREQFAEVFAL